MSSRNAKTSAYYGRGLAVENFPEGYPRISAYIDSDADTPLFRRFGILHARSLLYKQVELTELEAQLNQLDKEDEGRPGADENKWRLGHSISEDDGDQNEKRRDLMKQIDQKLEEYGISPLLLRARHTGSNCGRQYGSARSAATQAFSAFETDLF